MSRWRGRGRFETLGEILVVSDRKSWVSPFAHLGLPEMARRFGGADVAENIGNKVTHCKPIVEKSSAILVTAEADAAHLAAPKRRGRPKSDKPALTPAEKQRAYRERKKARGA